MMHGKKAAWDEYARWSKEDLQRNVEFMRRFNKELHDGCFCGHEGAGLAARGEDRSRGK